MHKKILIVDDDTIVLYIHDMVIKKSGLANETMSFTNASEALQYLNEQSEVRQHFLIFLDINMPIMNGWQFLTALEKTDYKDRLEVIVVSSSIDPSDLAKSKSFSMVTEYLSKPLTIESCIALQPGFSS